MVVLVDGAADGAQAVVAVGQHIRHREFLHAGGARRLNDADIGDVVAGQAVKAHAQVLHVAALVVRLENAVGDRALLGFLFRDGSAALARKRRRVGHDFTAIDKVYAAVVELYHGKIPFRVLSCFCFLRCGKRRYLFDGFIIYDAQSIDKYLIIISPINIFYN